MKLNMFLPTMEKRYAIAGSAIGALTPVAFAAGSLFGGSGLFSLFSSVAVSSLLIGATLVSVAGLGLTAAHAGREHDRANKMLTAERMGIAQLYHTAYHDALTGLGNRHALGRDFSSLLDRNSDVDNNGMLMLLDLDRFKYINDTLGHSAGDEVLMALTRRLRSGCGPGFRLYRLGGDEFVILCEDQLTVEAVDNFAAELASNVFCPVQYTGYDIDTSGSIGITFIKNQDDLSDVLKRADLALYNAKDVTGVSHSFFTNEMDREYKLRRAMEKDLRAGIADGGLRVAYQPIMKSNSLTPCAFSAQVCWKHPDHGEVAPELLLSLAQHTDINSLIDRWMIGAVIDDLANWSDQVQVAIPLSSEEIGRPGFASQFAERLAMAGVKPERFVFDIDFGLLSVRSVHHARDNLATVRAMGVKVSTSDYIGDAIDLNKDVRTQVDDWRLDLARLRLSEDSPPNTEVASNLVSLAEAVGRPVRFVGVANDADLAFVAKFTDCMAQGDFSGARMSGNQVAAYVNNMASVEGRDMARKAS